MKDTSQNLQAIGGRGAVGEGLRQQIRVQLTLQKQRKYNIQHCPLFAKTF